MASTDSVKCHIYGITFGEANRVYVGCARQDAEVDNHHVPSQMGFAQTVFDRAPADEERQQKLDVFEIESYASESEAEEALDFWRNYFRSLGFELYVDPTKH